MREKQTSSVSSFCICWVPESSDTNGLRLFEEKNMWENVGNMRGCVSLVRKSVIYTQTRLHLKG